MSNATRSSNGSKPKRKIRPHIRPTARKLRSKENADKICAMIEEGKTLAEIAIALGCVASSITDWIRDDASNGGAEIAARYARAVEIRAEIMADGLLEIADDERFMQYPALAAAMVTKQRLAVDTRKWLLSKMLPRKYGDRIEVSGDPAAPIVTRIELVAVAPRQLEPPTIDGKTDENDG